MQYLMAVNIRCRETILKGLSDHHVILFKVLIALQGHCEKSGLAVNNSMGPVMQLGHEAGRGGDQVTSSGAVARVKFSSPHLNF
jgi:hypothetical protein